MDPAKLAARFPRLFHMAHFDSWPSIEQHGLLSTSALLDLFEVRGAERDRIEAQWRGDSIRIEHPKHGAAVVRDQLPLRHDHLARCLTDGLSPADWYRILNQHVFFWVDESQLEVLINARAYRALPQTVLVLDTSSLLERHLADVRLSSINSGSILRGGAMRGPSTFRLVAEHDKYRVVELCVVGSVPDVRDLAVRVEHRWPDGRLDSVYERETVLGRKSKAFA
ncbi:MAG: hypothetical protein H0X16_11620 [Chloroflexi bacterium]|nr:hypothetical protein [Chloroflexota bacterium]